MQRTVRVLRIALPILFVGFVLLIIFSWSHRHAPLDSNTAGEQVPITRQGEKPQVYSKQFEDTQTIAGRVVSRIRATRVVAYTSNWNTLEDVALTIYRPNGLTYELVSPQAQFNSQTKEADVKGGVRVTSSDGVVIQTAALHFDGNRLTNHIPVVFTVDRWRGNAGALDLDVEAETLHLFDNLDAATSPAPNDPPMSVKANDGVFRRKENDVNFTKDVKLTRLADKLDADHVFGLFAQNRKTLVNLHGEGHVFMSLGGAAAPGENLGGRKDITCDVFYSDVDPAGVINGFHAVSNAGLVHAVIEGPPKRDIVAKSIFVALANKAVTEMKAEWQVVMKELGPASRQITSDHVTVSFDPAQHKATNAFLEGNVHYNDPKNSAASVRATYDITNDRVVMSADPGFDPTVTTDGNVVKAKQIEFSPRAGTARATGNVIAQLITRNGPAADGTNIFPANKPVFVNSDLLNIRNANKLAIFSGNVRAWQETNTIFAQELQVQGNGDSINARGNVRTVLYNSDTTGKVQRQTPVTSHSDQLSGRKNDRKLDLTGNVKMDDETRDLTAEHATFFFDANKKLDHVEADGKVVVTESSTGRKGTGDHAIYRMANRTAELTGKPATTTAPTGTVSGDRIAIDLAHNKVEVLSPHGEQTGTYKP
ncbi:MAG TPA: LPS export ABC transporter periplasmic protein LptC [Thermoanaerobaculia bacterium]|nr:LPS export ABC transporter periplasmic protein LptC [Thermoanaerobaculia bacterium]